MAEVNTNTGSTNDMAEFLPRIFGQQARERSPRGTRRPFVGMHTDCSICSICGYSPVDFDDQVRHMDTHSLDEHLVCNWPGCGKRFASACGRFRHLRIHVDSQPFVCRVDGCDKRCRTTWNRDRHMLTHSDDATLPTVPSEVRSD